MPNITYKSCYYSVFVYTTPHKRFVISTSRYFKLSWSTTALSQTNCRNFPCCSENSIITLMLWARNTLFLAKGIFQFTIYNATLGKSKMADLDIVTCSLRVRDDFSTNVSRSNRFFYLQPLFNRALHKGRMYGTWRVLVANVTTNLWILVASKVNLGALATVMMRRNFVPCFASFVRGLFVNF